MAEPTDALGRGPDPAPAQRVVAVAVVEDPATAAPLAEALAAGGVRLVEVALRTPASMEAFARMREAAPGLSVGLGTVLTADQARAGRDAGADFGLAPGCNPAVIRVAADAGLPFVPGVATPSDVELAAAEGCRTLKLFPAETLGGLAHLRALAGPYAHLGLSYLPLGGLNHNNAEAWLREPGVTAIGGSWICKPDALRAGDFAGVTRRARAAVDVAERAAADAA